MRIDSKGQPIQPGALYVEQLSDEYGPGEHRFERLVWAHSNGSFLDADTGLTVTLDCDTLVRQQTSLNIAYIDSGVQE